MDAKDSFAGFMAVAQAAAERLRPSAVRARLRGDRHMVGSQDPALYPAVPLAPRPPRTPVELADLLEVLPAPRDDSGLVRWLNPAIWSMYAFIALCVAGVVMDEAL